MKTKKTVSRVLYYLLASFFAVTFLFPFMVMFGGSFDEKTKFVITLTSWIPQVFTLNNYISVFSIGSEMTRWFINSCIISLIPTATGVFFAALLGYIFAKKEFAGRNIVFWFFMLAVMIPYQALIVSNYLVYNYLNWIDRYVVFLVPGLWTVIYMFMMKQFIVTIPDSLIEAARMDNAGEFTIFWKVILPLCKPALCTVAIFTFMDKWNDFMGPLIFTSSDSMFNLVVGLATMIQRTVSFKTQMTSGVITFIPIFVVFLALQRYFTDGIVMSGVKG